MKNTLANIFGKPSWPDPAAWVSERVDLFKKRPAWETLKIVMTIPVALYLMAQLWPFITDFPYLLVFLLTIAPFSVFTNLRRDAQKSITLTLLATTLLYFFVTKPLVFPPNPDALLFNERFFKFENYRYLYSAHEHIPKLFPPGTPKEKVDRVLVKYGGGNISL